MILSILFFILIILLVWAAHTFVAFYVLRHFWVSEKLLKRAAIFGGVLMLIWAVVQSIFTAIGADFAGPFFAAILAYLYVGKVLELSDGAKFFIAIGLPIVAVFPVATILMVVFSLL